MPRVFARAFTAASNGFGTRILIWSSFFVRRVFRIGSNAGTVGEKSFDLRNRKAMLLTLLPLYHSATYTNVHTFAKAGHEAQNTLLSVNYDPW
jgi:hypothetical protein